MDLKNSEIRELLLRDHEALRAELKGLEQGLKRAVADEGVRRLLREQLERVLESLKAHNEREVRLLKPVIVDLDAWGPLRAEQIDKEHEELREIAARFSTIDLGTEPKKWVEEVKALIGHVRD